MANSSLSPIIWAFDERQASAANELESALGVLFARKKLNKKTAGNSIYSRAIGYFVNMNTMCSE
jgi:hypothetical protein